MSLVVPAVLPISRKDLDARLALFASIPSVNHVQIDVVDGAFAAPASWPYTAPKEMEDMIGRGEMLPALERITYEVDLMCIDALSAADAWVELGAMRLTFHSESAIDLPKLLASARARHGTGVDFASGLVSFGLAINVASDLSLVESCIKEVEYLQIMGISQVGRQGQPLDPRVFEKISQFRKLHPEIPVQIDGGISLKNAKRFVALGVTNLVVGSSILRAHDPSAVVAEFEALRSPYGV